MEILYLLAGTIFLALVGLNFIDRIFLIFDTPSNRRDRKIVYEKGIKTLFEDNCESVKRWVHRLVGRLGRLWEDAYEGDKGEPETA